MYIKENTFAESCYNQNSIADLKSALNRDADETDMKIWALSESEYFNQIKIALTALEIDEG